MREGRLTTCTTCTNPNRWVELNKEEKVLSDSRPQLVHGGRRAFNLVRETKMSINEIFHKMMMHDFPPG